MKLQEGYQPPAGTKLQEGYQLLMAGKQAEKGNVRKTETEAEIKTGSGYGRKGHDFV